ncbi:hypothetical protein JW758_05640 [Candidatus Peregrinibacteria bacterium]|nr:hypothetical protein [Candidatus Peregrinibacteria bacterium]
MADVKPGQIEKKLVELMELKEKMLDTKEILKSFKVKSERLTDLVKAKKDISEQVAEEKDRIENEFYEDNDYEKAKNDELTLKNQIKEKNSELREMMKTVEVEKQLLSYDYNIKGEKVKMQVERVVKVYLNGKEEK